MLPNTFTAPTAEEGDSQASMINAKVQAMMAATNALKGNVSGKIHPGPFVPSKKRRLQDNKVIVKVRTAINERLNGRSNKNRHDPARDDHLLDSDLNEMQDDEELSQFVSAMDIRLNEGMHLLSFSFESLNSRVSPLSLQLETSSWSISIFRKSRMIRMCSPNDLVRLCAYPRPVI